jgi:hypothetical protein
MAQRINPEELREMLRVARRLRISAQQTDDAAYTHLFLRGAIALEERAGQLAYHPSDLEMPEQDNETPHPAIYRHVDLRC